MGQALDTKGRKTSFVQSDSVVRNIVRGEKENSCICRVEKEGKLHIYIELTVRDFFLRLGMHM